MDNKVKLFAVASVVAVFVSGCSGYNNGGTTGSDGYSSSQSANSGQVGSNSGYGQRRPAVANTCAPCAAKPKTTYTYKPRPKVVYKPRPKVVYKPRPKVVYKPRPKVVYKPRPKVVYKPRPVYRPQPRVVYKPRPVQQGQHNQQYYIDRWNRQQQQASRPRPAKQNYSGYGKAYTPVVGASSTTYYDYSTVGKTKYKPRNLSVSKKGIYTGAYQRKTYKPYKPVTYTGGSSYKQSTNNTIYSGRSAASPARRATTVSRGGNRYVVKKGDTVFEIMRQTGVYWKDIIRLNNLQKPYNINPGQSIRLK